MFKPINSSNNKCIFDIYGCGLFACLERLTLPFCANSGAAPEFAPTQMISQTVLPNHSRSLQTKTPNLLQFQVQQKQWWFSFSTAMPPTVDLTIKSGH